MSVAPNGDSGPGRISDPTTARVALSSMLDPHPARPQITSAAAESAPLRALELPRQSARIHGPDADTVYSHKRSRRQKPSGVAPADAALFDDNKL